MDDFIFILVYYYYCCLLLLLILLLFLFCLFFSFSFFFVWFLVHAVVVVLVGLFVDVCFQVWVVVVIVLDCFFFLSRFFFFYKRKRSFHFNEGRHKVKLESSAGYWINFSYFEIVCKFLVWQGSLAVITELFIILYIANIFY